MKNPTRRDFLRLGAMGTAVLAGARSGRAAAPPRRAPSTPSAAFEFEEATLEDLQRRMAQGTLTARRLTAAYLARIEALDRQGPALHHVIETNPEALAIADALDAERRAKGARGPLHGIPVLLKDNIETRDGQPTTAGSFALLGSPQANEDSLVVPSRES